jgi:DNA-binding NarL/FixJ family response regulator
MVKTYMVKKRPRAGRRSSTASSRRPSKKEPKYWRDRLYRNTFTYRGNSYEVGHWSVKIQHLGTRQTFSLGGTDRHEAAVEACKLYKTIVTRGWESVLSGPKGKDGKFGPRSDVIAVPEKDALAASYWAQRLIRRKYTEALHPSAERELSVRVDQAGTGHYFPLGTDNRKFAARQAIRIYQAVTGQGWASACKRFPRELSVAFRWADNPLAWTYTTIHTQPAIRRLPTLAAFDRTAVRLNVAIAESDAGLRRALVWCINQQAGCGCAAAFASAADALHQVSARPPHLFLISQNLADKAGIDCLKELNTIAPNISGLLFSVFEDSEQLFKAAPGGAPSYLFRRTPPTRILAPLDAALKNGVFTRERVANSARHYFENTIGSLPVGGSAHELTSLTQREHEILALLSKGHPDKEIADLLRISTWTVHGHLKKIFEKLKAHNRTDAVVKYLNK